MTNSNTRFAHSQQFLNAPSTWLLACATIALSYLVPSLVTLPISNLKTVWPLWPGCAILVTGLLLVRVSFWPVLVAASFVGFAVADLQAGVPLRSIAWFIPGNTVEVLISAVGLRYCFDGVPRLNSVRALANLAACNGAPSCTGWGVDYPSFSPDGSKIVAEVAQQIGNDFYDGIATMNADGTNLSQLTGRSDPNCASGWDEMPTFTNDGKQIVFSKICWDEQDHPMEGLYIMNSVGANVRPLLPAPQVGGWVWCQPRAVADRLVISTNQDYPNTSYGFELYSVMPDGSNLTRLTNNTLYDGLSTQWFDQGWPQTPSTVQKRLEHLRMLQHLRGAH